MDHDRLRSRSSTAVAARAATPTDLATRHKHGVSTLLAAPRRPARRHAFADVVEESVRWSA